MWKLTNFFLHFLFQTEHQKLVQASSVLSARCDQLVRELDSAKKMLAGIDEENAQLNDLLRVCDILLDFQQNIQYLF